MTLTNQDNLVLNELRKISKILLLSNSAQIDNELEKVADNEARKKMWVLIDGKRMPKDFATEVGVSLMTVSRFLDSASAADLVAYTPKKPPVKTLDYVPPSWLNLVFAETKEEPQEQSKTSPNSTKQEKQEEHKLSDFSGEGAKQ
ncbi:MAG: LacI family DNA-binding transcriptional regulator [Candidatus Bathyarchaeota archaeon]|nr:LacI family DNA-binding transcriptional regulator [Candidatus Bathyarchaeota archaeon]